MAYKLFWKLAEVTADEKKAFAFAKELRKTHKYVSLPQKSENGRMYAVYVGREKTIKNPGGEKDYEIAESFANISDASHYARVLRRTLKISAGDPRVAIVRSGDGQRINVWFHKSLKPRKNPAPKGVKGWKKAFKDHIRSCPTCIKYSHSALVSPCPISRKLWENTRPDLYGPARPMNSIHD